MIRVTNKTNFVFAIEIESHADTEVTDVTIREVCNKITYLEPGKTLQDGGLSY